MKTNHPFAPLTATEFTCDTENLKALVEGGVLNVKAEISPKALTDAKFRRSIRT